MIHRTIIKLWDFPWKWGFHVNEYLQQHISVGTGAESDSYFVPAEKIIKGVAISSGIAYGRGCFYQNNTAEHSPVNKKNLTDHNLSITDAFHRLDDQLLSLARNAEDCFDYDIAALFKAHRMICKELQSDVLNTIEQEKLTAKIAVEKCFDDYSEYFSNLDDNYISGRANDFAELKQLLLNLLNNTKVTLACKDYHGCQMGECVLKNEHILITDELLANVAIRIKGYTKGIITEKCGINSHAAVIARSLDIPVISGIKNPAQLISPHDRILINGYSGEIIINPDETTLERYSEQINKPFKSFELVEPLSQFTVLADIDRYQDVQKAVRVKADGIGLYRTEFEMLGKERVLSEDEQVTAYQHVIVKMNGKPVYFRLFDLGSDKSASWLETETEDNPALGCRGARFLLAHPELVKSQARALAKVSRLSPINVVYPMISSVNEFLQLKKLFMDAITTMESTNICHGIMFEVPSACINASKLYKVIDFGRIGTNDLVQYLFACDRTRDDFQYEKLIQDPALWKIITDIAKTARKAGKAVELCGEMASKPELIPELIKLGITTISTRPEHIATIRKAALSCYNSRPATV